MAPATSDATNTGGGCPVNHHKPTTATPNPSSSWWSRLMGSSEAEKESTTEPPSGFIPPILSFPRTLDQVKRTTSSSASACPVNVNTPINPLNNERLYPQMPHAGQKVELSKKRQVSSIKKSDFTPKHQPENMDKWVYPSEQQYFNAMKAKGYKPREEDVGIILAIHNAVNEQGWTEVMEWERMHDKEHPPKLKRFMGRPKDLSPKAQFLCMLGYTPPFDRHDWVVQRNDGTEVRYVIDFYTGAPVEGKPVSIHMDVRPALDSLGAAASRVQWQAEQWKESLSDWMGWQRSTTPEGQQSQS